MKSKYYDALKYVAQVGLPATATFFATVLPVWDIPDPTTFKIVTTTVAVNTFLGALLVISTVKYNASDARYDGTINPIAADLQTTATALTLKENPGIALGQKEVILKVLPEGKEI